MDHFQSKYQQKDTYRNPRVASTELESRPANIKNRQQMSIYNRKAVNKAGLGRQHPRKTITDDNKTQLVDSKLDAVC